MAKANEQVAHSELVGGAETTKHSHAAPKLNECIAPDGNVNFNQKQGVSFVVEVRSDDPVSPVNGQIWLRSDL